MTRTERQKEAVKSWIKNKGKGTVEAVTGFGKTRIGLMTIKAILTKYPQLRVLVVVPTTTLKIQWENEVYLWEFSFNVEVQVINTVIKHNWTCDFLVLDEIHRFNSNEFRQVFDKVKYKYILGLTATFERLDGKHIIMEQYCPIVNRITSIEASINGWVSEYKEYQVLINVDDIDTYKNLNKEFIKYFEFFGYDFERAKLCCGKDGWKYKLQLRDEMYKGNDEEKKKKILQDITINSMGLMRVMQKRKAFINNHPKKIEIAKEIIEARKNKKIITFSNNVKMAEAIGIGDVYTGRISKKRSINIIDDFNISKEGVLNTCAKANEGLDIKGLSVAIILGTDSSETKARQRRGRTIRKEENKVAEVFYIIIKDTVEEKWFQNSHKNDKNFLTIDEKGLEQVLNNQEPDLYRKPLTQLKFRF